MSGGEIEDKCQRYKGELKRWEKWFLKENGRMPGKEDVAQDKKVRDKYRKYYHYRGLIKKGKVEETGDKEDETLDSVHTPVKKKKAKEPSPVEDAVEEDVDRSDGSTPMVDRYIELGPTPQLNGRVLGLFESSLTPIKSTPPKKIEAPAMTNNASSPVVVTTPSKQASSPSKEEQKQIVAEISSTPGYLEKQATLDHLGMSPMGPQKIRKRLSSLIAESKKLREEFKPDEALEAMASEVEDSDQEEEEEDGDENNPFLDSKDKDTNKKPRKKKATQKRTTRRYKLKPVPTADEAAAADDGESRPAKKSKPQENFQRLKLRNTGYKGRPSKFRRR
jgi:DNA replication regulator SLD2